MNKTTPNRFPHPNIFVYYCLSRKSELEITNFLLNNFDIPKKRIKKNMHLTIYHSRRLIPGFYNYVKKIHLICNMFETRLMTLNPGGENIDSKIIEAN